jgi:hypothetical protein
LSYTILGDGKQPQLQTQIKKHEIINCLKVFGLGILKNNMKNKNKGRDSFIAKMRSPYERVFSQTNQKTM